MNRRSFIKSTSTALVVVGSASVSSYGNVINYVAPEMSIKQALMVANKHRNDMNTLIALHDKICEFKSETKILLTLKGIKFGSLDVFYNFVEASEHSKYGSKAVFHKVVSILDFRLSYNLDDLSTNRSYLMNTHPDVIAVQKLSQSIFYIDTVVV